EDPSFVPADQAGPIEDPIVDHPDDVIGELAPDPGEVAGGPTAEMVPCYQAYTLMEAKFLADQLTEQGIPALSPTQDIPDAPGVWDGNPRVYCRDQDLLRARAWLEAYDARRQAEHGRHEG